MFWSRLGWRDVVRSLGHAAADAFEPVATADREGAAPVGLSGNLRRRQSALVRDGGFVPTPEAVHVQKKVATVTPVGDVDAAVLYSCPWQTHVQTPCLVPVAWPLGTCPSIW